MYAVPPVASGRVTLPAGLDPFGPTIFVGGEPLDVPEAMEFISGMKRQNGERSILAQGLP
jgi:hypothetical protein